MIKIGIRTLGLASLIAIIWGVAPAQPQQAKRWYKGNLHTHTTMSDGDMPPEFVAKWYKDNGYNFLVISDHNVLTPVAALNETLAEPEKYLLIPGEEVTTSLDKRPVHINAYGVDDVIKPFQGSDMREHIQANVNLIRKAGALPSLNHPNFQWALQSKDLLAIENLPLIEVYNGHPAVNNRGGGGFESLEQMWDTLLTARKKVYGIAVDDAHNYKKFDKSMSNPGRGWVVVRAASLARKDIMDGVTAGDFYSSTGVQLQELETSPKGIRLKVKQAGTVKYTTEFIGARGKVLARAFGVDASYDLKRSDQYVRAVIHASNGDDAWVQPVVWH